MTVLRTSFQQYLFAKEHICWFCGRVIKRRGWAMHLKGREHIKNLKPPNYEPLFKEKL